jgi:uncharacterized membrane protein (DUF2068 family)
MKAPVGVRAIVIYKNVKAACLFLLGVVLAALVVTGYVERAHMLAAAIRSELVHPYSVKLAEFLLRWLSVARAWWVVAALFGDAMVSAVEGVALGRGYWWAPWLVVGATSLLLPIEVFELLHHATFGRAAILLVNLAIVLYLVKSATRSVPVPPTPSRDPQA